MTSKLTQVITTVAITFAMTTSGYAAIEIDEEDFGPSYETMVVDTAIGKPLQLAAAVTGTAAFLASIPFSILGGNVDVAGQKLVAEPWQAMTRCLGCTTAEDSYHKSQYENGNQVRIVVDQPSEIFINTNDNVVVLPR